MKWQFNDNNFDRFDRSFCLCAHKHHTNIYFAAVFTIQFFTRTNSKLPIPKIFVHSKLYVLFAIFVKPIRKNCEWKHKICIFELWARWYNSVVICECFVGSHKSFTFVFLFLCRRWVYSCLFTGIEAPQHFVCKILDRVDICHSENERCVFRCVEYVKFYVAWYSAQNAIFHTIFEIASSIPFIKYDSIHSIWLRGNIPYHSTLKVLFLQQAYHSHNNESVCVAGGQCSFPFKWLRPSMTEIVSMPEAAEKVAPEINTKNPAKNRFAYS